MSAEEINTAVNKQIANSLSDGMSMEDAVALAIEEVALNTGLEESEVWEVAKW
jgi:hypothetical protein